MATEKTFNFIFDCILQSTENIFSDKTKASHFCEHLKRRKRDICISYTGINNTVKANYMEGSARLLDRHKCAASFMIAFMEKLDAKVDKLGLERMAILIGLIVLKLFISFENRNYCDSGIISFIEKNNGFVFPPRICDDRPYFDSWALELYYARKENKLFALSVSHVLFCIETHKRQLVEIESLKQS
jgi:hypothetical protein